MFALFDFMRAHCICCIGEEGFLNEVVFCDLLPFSFAEVKLLFMMH